MGHLLYTLALWLVAAQALAHPMAPASVALREGADGELALRVRATPQAYPMLHVPVPDGCEALGPVREQAQADAVEGVRRLRCSEVPGPESLEVQGLDHAGIDAVVRVRHVDGRVEHALRSPGGLGEVLQAESEPPVFVRYLLLGFEHLWAGPDHVLFVLCLLLLVRRLRGAALSLTAFTLGHACTLTLSALDLVRLPQAPAEVLIAASLVWMAGSVLLHGRGARHVAPVALGFGLIHGLGFASVLRDVGLPSSEVPLSLLGFNLGIELAQLSLAVIAWGTLSLLQLRFRSPRLELASAYAVACLTGVLGAFWVFERVVSA